MVNSQRDVGASQNGAKVDLDDILDGSSITFEVGTCYA